MNAFKFAVHCVRGNDPTYAQAEIKANPVWHLAWVLSEIDNDEAPLGWGRYITTAEVLLSNCDIVWKERKSSDA